MTISNKLTLARIVLTAFFVMALLLPVGGLVKSHFPLSMSGALLIFVVASITDWLDGEIARRRHQETSFGALLDPLADKILTTAAFICFIELKDYQGHALVQAWMVLVIVARDFLVTGLRLVAREHDVVLKAEQLGKHKTISQMVTIIVVLVGLAGREDWNCFGQNCERFDALFSRLVFVLMLITVALTVWSGAAYYLKNRRLFLQDA